MLTTDNFNTGGCEEKLTASLAALRKGRFAMVLNNWPAPHGETFLPASAQLVLSGMATDPTGNICLTPPLKPADILASVDVLKAELDALVDETLFAIVSRAAHCFETRRKHSNDNFLDFEGGENVKR
jgi:hypothetical protein